MSQEIEVKASIWKRIMGGFFVLLAFVFGAAVTVLVKKYWLDGLLVMLIPWLFGWSASWILRRKGWF